MPRQPFGMRARLAFPFALAGAAALIAPRPAPAAPAAVLWERWLARDPAATESVAHHRYAALLERFVVADADGINRVRYAALKSEGRDELGAYLGALQAVAVDDLAPLEQMAFWINLYNALTLAVVTDHYPVASIRAIAISPGLFSRGPWGRKLAAVAGEALSLDDIEHRILRPIWRDPRVHYAINCAALGCPNLQRLPFSGNNLDAMLEQAAADYVGHPRGVAMLPGGFGRQRLTVSRIYDWFEADFGGGEAGVLDHLRRHARGGTARLLADIERIDAYRYDWGLNDTAS